MSKHFTGYVHTRFAGFQILEGAGRNGGEWAVRTRRGYKIFDSLGDAQDYVALAAE